MNLLAIAKGALGLVISTGVGNIVGNAVKMTTPAGQNTFNKVATNVGAFVLAAMIADKTVEYSDAQFEKIFPTKQTVNASIPPAGKDAA